jgi:hypothetical protein
VQRGCKKEQKKACDGGDLMLKLLPKRGKGFLSGGDEGGGGTGQWWDNVIYLRGA